MSRFFVSGYTSDSSSEEEDLLSTSEEELLSSSENESDSSFFNEDEEDESDESSSDEDSGRPSGPAYFLKKSFLKGSGGDDSDSDSDDEGRKVVKSAKDKLLDDMKSSIEVINSNKYTNNWTIVLNEFDKFGRFLIRCNQTNIGTPRFYIKLLTSLDNSITETINNEKDDKTMKADEARSFNTLRQRIKKQIREFQVYYDLYKENPEEFDEKEDESLESLHTAAMEGGKDENEGVNLQPSRVLSPVFHTLKVISESRGKKNVDKTEQVSTLEKLLETHATTGSPFELISIYQMLLSIRFDASSYQTFMPVEQWKKNEQDLGKLLDLLEANVDKYQVSELGVTTDDIDIEPVANANGVKVLFGSITSSIDRLDDEFTKSLQNTDPHSIEYVERLKDETTIYNLIVRGQVYVEAITPKESVHQSQQLARIVLRRLEHVYYKPNQLIKANEEEAWKHIKNDSSIVTKGASPKDVIDGLSKFLQELNNKIYGKHAILFSIYYYAVNNQYQEAKELFLSSQFYANINSSESSLQVQYNRALVQLGLSAFRSGHIDESHKILNEVVNSQRAKELLGQGFSTKFPNQATVVEKQKLLPFHQHINLELLECVFMTCSLLIEIPTLAAIAHNHKDPKRKNQSLKSFKSKLEFHDRQFFTGPPESIKDHIVHASIALQKGDWSKSYKLLSSIKIWRLFPDTEELLTMMKNQLQIEGLRTYIFTYKSVFTKLSIDKLLKIFELSNEEIVNILNKMVESGDINGEIIDDKFISFIASTTEPQRSKLQELAIVLNEKIQLLTEKNEKTQSNGYGKKQQNQPQQQQQQKDGQQQQQKDGQQQNASTPQPQQQQQPTHTTEEHSNKFRYANVNSNNDEFQATA